MSASPDIYRERLLPFIDRWVQDEARVVIFGTGPHTDLLFDYVPELERVALAGFVVSKVPTPAPLYRGHTVKPLSWAYTHADVIVCSSFVSEPAMAAMADPLPCKVVMSHAERDPRLAPAPRIAVTFRPSAIGRRIRWPAMDTRFARYLEDTRVLDAIVEAFYPFVDAAEADLARAIVRHVHAGMTVVEVGSPSPRLTALLARCVMPAGRVASIRARFDATTLRPLVSEAGLRVETADEGACDEPTLPREAVSLVESFAYEGTATNRAGRTRQAPASKARVDFCVVHVGNDAIDPAILDIAKGERPVVLAALGAETSIGSVAKLQAQIADAGYRWVSELGSPAPGEAGSIASPTLLMAIPAAMGEGRAVIAPARVRLARQTVQRK